MGVTTGPVTPSSSSAGSGPPFSTRHPNARGADRRPNWHRQSGSTRRRGGAPDPNSGPRRRGPRDLNRPRRVTRARRGRWPHGRDLCPTRAPSRHHGRPLHRCGGHARPPSDLCGRDGGQRHGRPTGAPTRLQGKSRLRRSVLRALKCSSDRRAPRGRHPPGPRHVNPTWRYPQGSTRPSRGGRRRNRRGPRHVPPPRFPRGTWDLARPQGATMRGRRLAPRPHPGTRRPGTRRRGTPARPGRHAPCRRDTASARGKRPTRPPPLPTTKR